MQRNILAPPGLVQWRRYRSSPAVPIEAMRCNARMALVIWAINLAGGGSGTNSTDMSLAIRDVGG